MVNNFLHSEHRVLFWSILEFAKNFSDDKGVAIEMYCFNGMKQNDLVEHNS